MNISNSLAMSGILLFIGILLVLFNLRKYLLIQKIRNTPLSKIRSAAVGLVELSGSPGGRGNLLSPVSGKECLYWRVIARYAPLSTNTVLFDLFDIESGEPFMLKDGSGSMPIDARGANIDGLKHNAYRISPGGRNKEWIIEKGDIYKVFDFISGLDDKLKSKFEGHREDLIDILESYLPPSETLYVLGNAEPQDGKRSDKAHENLIVRKKGMMFVSTSQESDIIQEKSSEVSTQMVAGLVLIAVSLFLISFELMLL